MGRFLLTSNGGVTVFHNLRAKSFAVKEGLAHPYVQGITQDPTGVVWVATGQYFDGGVSAFERVSGGWKFKQVLHRSEGLAGEKARSVAVDADDNLWVGSESDGLAILHGSTSNVLSTANGLPDNEITCIRFDSEGNAWLATLRGVVKIPFAEIERLIGPPPPQRGK